MSVYQLAIRRPIATGMLFFTIIVFGVFSYTRLPVDLFPEIEAPVVTVLTMYPGAGAQEVERNVTEQLENVFSVIPNLDEIRSESVDNISSITLIFDWGVDMLEVSDNVRDAVSRARMLLPSDIEEPIIQKFDTGAIPIIILSATAEESYYDLETILDDHLVAPINRINGVGAVNLFGAPTREIHVLIDPVQFEAYHLDIMQVGQMIGAENVIVPAGHVDLGVVSYNLRTNSEFQSEQEIGDIVVTHNEGRAVYLHEVATILSDFEDENSISRVNSARGVAVIVNKQSDANTVAVARQIIDRLPEIEQRLPEDVQVSVLLDTSEFISGAINNLSSVILYAVIFVILIVFVFLHRWRATIIIAVTIPVSLVMAFIYLALTGGTLNIISLSSMAIALGMVVDDAIVVLENVMKRVEAGDEPSSAAVRGSREVITAVIASTLTVVAVFLPLTFVTGMMGFWFRELGFIVVVTVVTSTISALMLTPMLASVLIPHRDNKKMEKRITGRFTSAFDRQFAALENAYGRSVSWSIRWRKTVVAGAIVIFAATIAMIPVIGTEFMPVSDNNQIQIEAELATGRSIAFTGGVIREMEQIIEEEVPEIRNIMIRAGGTGMGGATPSHVINANIQLVGLAERERTVFEIGELLRQRFDRIPEIHHLQVEAGGGGAGSARPIEINILGRDLDATTRLSDDLIERMREVEGLRDIRRSRGDDRPEFELKLDREKLAASGLNSSSVSNVVRGKMDGLTATKFRRDGNEYDVLVRYRQEDRHSLASIENISLMSPLGTSVRVSDLGTVNEIRTPPNIERLNRERVVSVTSGLHDRALSDAVADIRAIIDQMEIPADVEILYGGDIEEQAEAFADLLLVLLLSLVLVYIVMAGQFESFRDPLVIMFSIPFSFTGVLIALLITGTALSVIGMLGAVILVGIVVKNAIVLIDYIRLLQSEGMKVVESIVEAGKMRLRPVLMTTLTTVLAMLPLALAIGEGAEMWSPMAISVIGGLSFSAIITLGLIPVIYAIAHRKRIRAESAAEA